VKMFTLTVTASPVEGGSVLPAGGVFDDGAVVTLTAVPASGFTFDHWTGDVSGNTTTISVNMNDNKNATAVFLASP
jgi:hypothetical protein